MAMAHLANGVMYAEWDDHLNPDTAKLAKARGVTAEDDQKIAIELPHITIRSCSASQQAVRFVLYDWIAIVNATVALKHSRTGALH